MQWGQEDVVDSLYRIVVTCSIDSRISFFTTRILISTEALGVLQYIAPHAVYAPIVVIDINPEVYEIVCLFVHLAGYLNAEYGGAGGGGHSLVCNRIIFISTS